MIAGLQAMLSKCLEGEIINQPGKVGRSLMTEQIEEKTITKIHSRTNLVDQELQSNNNLELKQQNVNRDKL